MTGAAVQKRVAHCLKRAAIALRITYTNGVSDIVCNHGSCCRLALENRGRIYGDLLRRKAGTRSYHRVYVENRSWIANGVIDAIQDVDYTRKLGDCIGDLGSLLVQLGSIGRKQFDLHRLRSIGQVTDHVLKHLDEFDVE